MKTRFGCIALLWLSMVAPLAAQNTGNTVTTVQVPRLVRISGTLNLIPEIGSGVAGAAANEAAVHHASSVVGVTFALYAEETGGAPLWLETQNVQLDNTGHYSALLGATQAEGLPVELFASGQAQWLGVQQQGQAEQPRIMLLSVPYALKAADAETFGGKPPSAYAPAAAETNAASGTGTVSSGGATPKGASPHPLPISGSGTANYLPLWTNASTLSNSAIYQSSNGGLGIGTTSPQALLDVEGGATTATISAVTTTTNGFAIFGGHSSTTGNGSGVYGTTNSSSGTGVLGSNTSTSGLAVGVAGISASSGGIGVSGSATDTSGQGTPAGVAGNSMSPTGIGGIFTNAATSGNAAGAAGFTSSPTGYGVTGIAVESSHTGPGIDLPIGVWGDTGTDGGVGLAGTADNGVGVEGVNDSTNIATADFENLETSSGTAPVLLAHATNIGGSCLIDVSGNLSCTGSKSAIVPVDGGSRKVALYAVESPENWFEDFGSGQLSHGSAVISLEPTFSQTVNSAIEYHVFLTPTGDCKGLYVSNKTADSFEVHEVAGGTSSIGFDYRIMVRRKGYENVRLADRTEQFNFSSREEAKTGAQTNRLPANRGLQQSFRNFSQLPSFIPPATAPTTK